MSSSPHIMFKSIIKAVHNSRRPIKLHTVSHKFDLLNSKILDKSDKDKEMSERRIKVFGKVTDFEKNPLQDAVVEIKSSHFEAIHRTYTNSAGEYEILLEKGLYMALMAYKDYKTKYLEYWAWDIPAYQDLQIDPCIGRLEVYAMNAFRPQGAYPSLFIYFRPMSLKRFQEFESRSGVKKIDVIDISPDLSKDCIEVKINGKAAKILELNRVKEYAGGIDSIIAYLAQLTMPKKSLIAYLIKVAFHIRGSKSGGNLGYTRVDVTIRDAQTGEKGEGSLFWESSRYK
jgi:hypothetical protein